MCESYTPWTQAPYALNTAECVEYGAHDGLCHETMSPHSGQACPDAGYPLGLDSEAWGRAWKAPVKED